MRSKERIQRIETNYFSHITFKNRKHVLCFYRVLCNNQINARALIGQSALGYCAGKPMEKSRVF